jgi:perosamine synthetase
LKRIGDKERDYVLQVLEAQFRSSAGSMMTKRLEETFAAKFNVKYAISFINGTATMHAALVAAGIGPGDEVIVPPLTMSSTSFAVLHANAIPVFADIDPNTFTIDPASIRKVLTKRTKAIIPVALYGLSPDMDEIMGIAKEHNLIVIEDDAQCFLGYYKDRIVGSIGHMSSFSFQSSKHITSGEGGMITTNDDLLADRIRKFNSLGYAGVSAKKGKITKEDIQDPNYERHVSLGFNYRLPELCSAVALAQVERMDELVQKRVENAQIFSQAIKGCSWLKPQKVPDGYKHSYWTYVLKLEESVPFSWYDFRRKYIELGGDGIYAAWQLTYLEPLFRNHVFYPKGCPVSCSHFSGSLQKYEKGLCRQAEKTQPRLLQFKTNYLNNEIAERKADALVKTIRHFNS